MKNQIFPFNAANTNAERSCTVPDVRTMDIKREILRNSLTAPAPSEALNNYSNRPAKAAAPAAQSLGPNGITKVPAKSPGPSKSKSKLKLGGDEDDTSGCVRPNPEHVDHGGGLGHPGGGDIQFHEYDYSLGKVDANHNIIQV